ncbi:MAG TPA: hypothetical protein VIY49_17800 [Bryobacteraceae bacterium]
MEKPVLDRLKTLPGAARMLFAVIARQAYQGPIRGKAEGVATPPEILEACGLDPEEFYALLKQLEAAGLVLVSNSYPFEEIRLTLAGIRSTGSRR